MSPQAEAVDGELIAVVNGDIGLGEGEAGGAGIVFDEHRCGQEPVHHAAATP